LPINISCLLRSGACRGPIVLNLGGYCGFTNSAWFGAFLATVATTFFSLVGFYIVRNCIQRDEQTRVGQILAATPVTKSEYTAGKALSNFAVLASMVLILAVGAVVLQLLRGHQAIDFWQLLVSFRQSCVRSVDEGFRQVLPVLFRRLFVSGKRLRLTNCYTCVQFMVRPDGV